MKGFRCSGTLCHALQAPLQIGPVMAYGGTCEAGESGDGRTGPSSATDRGRRARHPARVHRPQPEPRPGQRANRDPSRVRSSRSSRRPTGDEDRPRVPRSRPNSRHSSSAPSTGGSTLRNEQPGRSRYERHPLERGRVFESLPRTARVPAQRAPKPPRPLPGGARRLPYTRRIPCRAGIRWDSPAPHLEHRHAALCGCLRAPPRGRVPHGGTLRWFRSRRSSRC